MKKISICMFLLLILSACGPAAPTEIAATMTPESTSEDDPESKAVEDAVVELLAGNLGLNEDEISVQSNEEVEFSDACMDIAVFSDITCAQVETPGRIVVLEAEGIEYEYHTSPNGDLIQPATLALTWTREGGIAGFCDQLVVFISGEVYGTNCRSQPKETSGNFSDLLSAAEQKRFTTWYLKYGEAIVDQSDPAGVSDRMSITLSFFGSGNGKPTKADQQALLDWASRLFQKLNS
jgi:hypothetical protein